MVSFPRMVRTTSGLGEARYALGDRLVDRYLEFVAGRARPNTLRAVAFDLKTFAADDGGVAISSVLASAVAAVAFTGSVPEEAPRRA